MRDGRILSASASASARSSRVVGAVDAAAPGVATAHGAGREPLPFPQANVVAGV
jgi:hypothetical protein